MLKDIDVKSLHLYDLRLPIAKVDVQQVNSESEPKYCIAEHQIV